jgi:hypothetical protein
VPSPAEITPQYFAAWDDHDVDRIASFHAENGTYHLHAGGEPSEGRDAIREAFQGIFDLLPGFKSEINQVIHGDSHWVLDWTMTADGGISLHMVDVVQLDEDGLIASKDVYADVAQYNALAEQQAAAAGAAA